MTPYISLKEVNKSYIHKGATLNALNGINLDIPAGKTFGIVGESGSGKSTLGKIITGIESPTKGEVLVNGSEIRSLSRSERHEMRRGIQMIFQDPYSSLNPMMSIEQCIGEGIDIHKIAYGSERRQLIGQLLESVGLPSDAMKRYPHEFSGGQRQRIVIARALAVNPQFLVCDEPIASLDICTQRQVMDLFAKLKRERNLSMMFISHDISAVLNIADYVAVMYLGSIVEQGPAEVVLKSPLHPYTQALISSIPLPDPAAERVREKIVLLGDPPSPLNLPQGCAFRPRCRFGQDLCASHKPALVEGHDGRSVACHRLTTSPFGDNIT